MMKATNSSKKMSNGAFYLSSQAEEISKPLADSLFRKRIPVCDNMIAMANLGCQLDTWGDRTLIEELSHKNGLWDLFLIANCCQRAHPMDDTTLSGRSWLKQKSIAQPARKDK